MKRILTVTLITIASLANGLAGDVKYKSYIELQEERERIADARYAQFRQEQDVQAQLDKEAAEARAWQSAKDKKDLAWQRSQERIAAAGAPKVNVPALALAR
jgi:phage-related minor tail protein